MKHLIIVLMAGLFSLNVSADCNGHLEFQVKDKKNQVDEILCRGGYAVGYSYFYKNPIWVSYRLTKSSVAPNNQRNDSAFKVDQEVPEKHRATKWDYKYSGFDKGHMAPRAAMDSTPALRDESYLMTNMTPQHPLLNQRGWRHLEAYVRALAIKYKEIYVITGALFKGENRTIGRGVYIPSDLYKVIYIPSMKKMLAFSMANKPFSIDDLESVQRKVDWVERRSGLDFFSELQNKKEAPMEKSTIDYCEVLSVQTDSPCP